LYRKYRPETFTEVMGQEHIETTLRNAVQTGSISHAYLFCGPRGTGKTTTARLLAKALLCEHAPTDHPDGTCEQCREIANGIHPDVYELDAASRTGVENVREEIIGRVQFAPTRGAYKIYIIDEVHMLSTAAFNALLKTLEEPPTHVLFVLCTTDSHKVPPTIQSRCQRFDFHRLSEQQITARLAHICEQEGYTVEPEALSLIAQRSQGGMRDAISSLEQVAVFGTGVVSFEAAESMLGEVSTEQLFSVAALIARRDVAACFAWVASFTQSGTDIAQFVRDLSGYIRNVYIASVLGNAPALAEIVEVDDEQVARYLEQAALFDSSDRLAHVLVVLGDLSVQLRSTANARLALEIALTRMARPGSDLTLESLAARIAVLETRDSHDHFDHSDHSKRPALPVDAPAAPAVSPAPAPAASPAPAEIPSAQASLVPALAPAPASDSTPAPAPATASTSAPVSDPASIAVTSFEDAPSSHPTQSEEATSAPVTSLTLDAAHRLWTQVGRELPKAKMHGLAASLGGSSARPDPKTKGLLIELPNDASFAKQNLERQENWRLLAEIVERLHGASLPFTFVLGPERKPSGSASSTELFAASETSKPLGSPTVKPAAPAPAAAAPESLAFEPAAPAPAPAPESSAPAPEEPTFEPEASSKDEPSPEDIIFASFGSAVTVREVDEQD
jgi:DNA polymerase-3 subunit gamma/tau